MFVRQIEGFYTLEEFAEVSGYAASTLYAWLGAGRLEGQKDSLSNRWLIPDAELERLQANPRRRGRKRKELAETTVEAN